MGTYLIENIIEDPQEFCDRWAAVHRSRFSALRVKISDLGSPAARAYAVHLTVEVTQGTKSLLALTVVADFILYSYNVLQVPYSMNHYKQASSGGGLYWIAVPSSLPILLAVSAAFPTLVLAAFRALLDRHERRLSYSLEDLVGEAKGSFTTLLPPRNWAIFPDDAAVLLLTAGLLFAVNCMIWLAGLRQASQIIVLVIPYLVLMVCALAAMVARGRMRRVSAGGVTDTRLMLSLNRIHLTSRIGIFFAFPLAFYSLISLAQGLSYALAYDSSIPPTMPRVGGQASGMFILTVGEPQLQQQGQFDQWIATKLLAPSSLDVALIGVVVAAGFMYLSVFRHWTLLGIYSASAKFPVERARPPAAVPRASSRAGATAIILEWLLLLITNLCGAAVILIIALWATRRYIYGPVVERSIILPMSPLEWYKTIISMWLTRALAEGILAVLIIPGALALIIWAYSLLMRIALATRLLFPSRSDTSGRLVRVRSELRRLTGHRPPSIRLERRLDLPRTDVLLPFRWACFIRVPQHCVENMNDSMLISVIAHEMVHVRLDVRRLWWLEFFSWLTITGPGLLTLLLDFPAMEFRADELALRWTGDRRAAKGALEYFRDGKGRAEAGESGGPARRLADAVRRASNVGLMRFRRTFFEYPGLYPGEERVRWQERIDRIASHD
jgi:hypothetical protein